MRRIGLLAAAALVLILLGLAQLILPGVAAQRLRDRLAASGEGVSVHVHAFPAIELLWHDADRVEVSARRFRASATEIGNLLVQAAGVGTLRARVGELDAGLLVLRDATLDKQANRLSGSARVVEGDLRRAVPILQSVVPVPGPPGTLTLEGTASLLGITATVPATVQIDGGALVLTPQVPFGGLARVTVFSDPRVAVTSLSAQPTAGGFSLAGAATLR